MSKNSRSRTRRRQAKKVAAARGPHRCEVPGCFESFKQSTDLSRHKWMHVPTRFLPTCPYISPSGQLCEERYRGRSDAMKEHWVKKHRDAGPYPDDTSWDTLKNILRDNRTTLGQDSAAVPSASAGPSRFPAPPPARFLDSTWAQAGPSAHIPHSIPFQNRQLLGQGYNSAHLIQHITPLPLPQLNYGHYPTNPQYPNNSTSNYPLVGGQAQEHPHLFTPAYNSYSPENSQDSQYPATPELFACDQGPYSPSGRPCPTPYGHELAGPSRYPANFPHSYNNGAYSQHSAHLVHQTITSLPATSFIGGYSPPFPQRQGPILNPHLAYGQPPPYPRTFARPPEPVYTPTSSSRYEECPEDYFRPRHNNRAHSPACAHSSDGDPADRETSTNPSPSNDDGYHHDQNSSFNPNHRGI